MAKKSKGGGKPKRDKGAKSGKDQGAARWLDRRWIRYPFWLFGWLFCLFTVAGFFGRFSWMMDMFSHFRVQYVLVLGLWAPAAWLLYRRRLAGAVFGLMFLVNATMILPFLSFPDNRTGRYRVLAANVDFLNPDLSRVERYILRQQPDFVILSEVPWHWRYKMPELVKAYPYCYDVIEMKPSRIVLCSRFKPEKVYPLRTWDYNPGLFAEFKLEGRNFTLVGIHPASARLKRDHQDRMLQYRQLAFFFTRTPPGELMVVGDFNATPWSYYFRLLTARMSLYNSMKERGLHFSWPVGPFQPLAVPIDNCIHTGGIVIRSMKMGNDLGSDHYPLLVEFDLASPPAKPSAGVTPPAVATPR